MSDAANPTWDLFVSYADADRGWVEGYLLDGLRAAGVRCLTQADFGLGEHWTVEFERAAAQSHRVLLVLSRAYLADVNQRLLDSLARYHELKNDAASVIPLVLDDGELPLGLEAKVSLRATTDAEKAEAVERLTRACQAGPPSDGELLACPYPGMAAFDGDNADLFHGRKREVEDLLQELRHRRCLFLIGRSGSGKSSLVLAGLLPRLKDGRTVHVMRPGATPAATLAALTGSDSGCCLLVVDQFEEVYTNTIAEEAARFQEALCAWLEPPERVLLVTVRADFYPDLQNSPTIFPLFQANHRPVLPLGKEALREAIVEPAARRGVFVEPALIERLLADAAGEPCVLPHLQETLQLLWARRRRRYLSLEAYQELGRDGRTGLQQAMAVVADAAVDTLEPAEQALARRTFLRLVQFGEGRADTRRSQPLSALESAADPPGTFERVLARLILRRLVVPDVVRLGTTDLTVIDLAHEALIAGWPRLQGWVRQARAAEQTRRSLEGRAGDWVRLGRGSGGLLDEVELREAQEWLSRHGDEMGASAELRALIQTSGLALRQAEQQREAAHQRELAQARALAAEQRRRAGILRWSLLGAVVLLVVLGVMAWFAWRQSQFTREARDQDRRNTARHHARIAEGALKQGAWDAALQASKAAREEGYPDEVGLGLIRVRAFAALNNLPALQRELNELAGRSDLGSHEGTVRLWQGDFLLSRSALNWEEALRLVREAVAKGIEDPAETEYARALLANNWNEAVAHLGRVLDIYPFHQRATLMLAGLDFWTGHLTEARARVRQAELIFRKDPTLKILHALICAMDGQAKEARRHLKDIASRLSERQGIIASQLVESALKFHEMDMAFARGDELPSILARTFLPWYLGATGLAGRLRSAEHLADDILLPPVPPFMIQAMTPFGAELREYFSLPKLLALLSQGPKSAVALFAVLGRGADVLPDGFLHTFRGVHLFLSDREEEAEAALMQALTKRSLFRSARLVALQCAAVNEWTLANRRPPRPEMRARAVNHLRELVQELTQLRGMDPSRGAVLTDLAFNLKQFDLAYVILGEWAKRTPKDPEMLLRLLRLECATKNYSRALALTDQLLGQKLKDQKLLTEVRDRQRFIVDELRRLVEVRKPSP